MIGRLKLPQLPAPYLAPDVEHRVRLRAAVLINTVFAFCAYATVDADMPIALPILAAVLGAAYSHAWRGRSNFWLKWVLAAGMLYALYQAMDNLVRGTIDTRLSLAQLLLWLQVLNSFDLPRRKNLRVALLVTAILMVVAATMSRSMAYGAMLLGYAFTLVWAMHEAHLSELGLKAVSLGRSLTASAAALMGVVAVGLPLYLAAPRQARQVATNTLPLSVRLPLPEKLDPRVRGNDPLAGQGKGATARGYGGFSEHLDLNVRGTFSDKIVMRVRSDRPQYWRAMAFDRYDGHAWRMSEPDAVSPSIQVPATFPRPKGQAAGIALVTTFYIEEDQANLIFTAWTPRQIYFPAPLVWQDRYDALRSPVTLEKDMFYSVVAETPVFDARALGRQRAVPVPAALKRYLQLPPTITERVRAETRRLGASASTPYAKMAAFKRHLASHYPYKLDVPPAPDSAEWVDHFMFVQREGFCEQFATSLAVMGRLSGIPTRLVTGYVPGDYNPLSGFFEVKGKHAHAWVEAWVPTQGWVPFDATPGSDTEAIFDPDAEPMQNPAVALWNFVFPWLAGRPWGPAAVLAGVIGLLAIGWRLAPRSGRSGPATPPTALYRKLKRRTRRLGVPESPHDTPGAWLEAVATVPRAAQAAPELEAFVRAYEAARFGGGDGAEAARTARAAEAALSRKP